MRYKGNLKEGPPRRAGSYGPTPDPKGERRYETGEVSEHIEELEVGPRLRKLLTAKMAARALARKRKFR